VLALTLQNYYQIGNPQWNPYFGKYCKFYYPSNVFFSKKKLFNLNIFLMCQNRSAGKELLSLIALSLNLDEDYFQKISASNKPDAFLRLLRYPGSLINVLQSCI